MYPSAQYGPRPAGPQPMSVIRPETWQAERVDQRGVPVPPTGVLVGVSLWAMCCALLGSVVGAAALITVAGRPPTWYAPAMLISGAVAMMSTIGGLRLVGTAWLRWKLLAIGTAAVVAAALLTVAAHTG